MMVPSADQWVIPAMRHLSPFSKLLLLLSLQLKVLLHKILVLTGRHSSSMICGTQSDLDVSATAEVVLIIRER